MNLKNILLSISILFLTFTTVTSNAKNPPIYTKSHNNIIVTYQNPTFTLKLKSNPTTGYSWSLKDYSKEFLTLITHRYQRPSNTSNLVGKGGYELWTFHVKSSAFKTTHKMFINMVYERPWEKQKSGKEVKFRLITKQAN